MTPANVPSSEAPARPPAPGDLLPLVLRVVRTVVDAPDSGITGDTALLYLPGFDSMKLVQIVEEVEAAAGIEIDPERITPEAFASPGTIAETIAGTGTPRSVAPGSGTGTGITQGGNQ